MAKSRRSTTGDGDGGAADLSYNQARMALELVLAELQASDLDVEAMASLYQRGQAYAQRCSSILDQVEQEVLVWHDVTDPTSNPIRYEPDADPT
jgi:exodeoxyribonuclease VII small subunit